MQAAKKRTKRGPPAKKTAKTDRRVAFVSPLEVYAPTHMEFRILGPIEVRSEGRQARLGGVKQRALLAVLLLHRNEVVSIDGLIDELWDDRPPATAVKTVQVYVSQLRKALRGRDAGEAEEILVTRAPATFLRRAGRARRDRFERLVEEGASLRSGRETSAGGAHPARGPRALARAGPCRLRPRSVRAERDRTPRGGPGDGARGADRGRSRARPPPRADRRARVAVAAHPFASGFAASSCSPSTARGVRRRRSPPTRTRAGCWTRSSVSSRASRCSSSSGRSSSTTQRSTCPSRRPFRQSTKRASPTSRLEDGRGGGTASCWLPSRALPHSWPASRCLP